MLTIEDRVELQREVLEIVRTQRAKDKSFSAIESNIKEAQDFIKEASMAMTRSVISSNGNLDEAYKALWINTTETCNYIISFLPQATDIVEAEEYALSREVYPETTNLTPQEKTIIDNLNLLSFKE